jgi:UTP--glucose-1-phosphate uridylyltransferase
MKAIIPAAGLGTRFLPATKAIPKEMLPVGTKPTIQYVVEEALAAEADEVVIVTNATKAAIAAHFSADEELARHLERSGKDDLAAAVRHAGALPVSFVEQTEPLGLGHAVGCAAAAVLGAGAGGAGAVGAGAVGAGAGGAIGASETEPLPQPQPQPFYVLLGDVIVPEARMLPQMLEISRAHGQASVIAVLRVPADQVSRFGIIAGEAVDDDVWRITDLVEKPALGEAPSDLAIFGRYLLSPTVMRILEHTAAGAGGEIQLTDALVELLAAEEIYALIIDPEEGLDVGTVADWIHANNKLQ